MVRDTLAHLWGTVSGRHRAEAEAKRRAEAAAAKHQAEAAEAKRQAKGLEYAAKHYPHIDAMAEVIADIFRNCPEVIAKKCTVYFLSFGDRPSLERTLAESMVVPPSIRYQILYDAQVAAAEQDLYFAGIGVDYHPPPYHLGSGGREAHEAFARAFERRNQALVDAARPWSAALQKANDLLIAESRRALESGIAPTPRPPEPS
jgi:hypothetical protein